MIQAQQKTLRVLYHTRGIKAEFLYAEKLKELKHTLQAKTDELTDLLYRDEITLPKYLREVEKLYSHLKETQ